MRKNMKKKNSRTNLLYCLEFNFTDGATFFCSSIKFMGKEKWIHENSSWCHINHVTKCFVIFAIILSRYPDLKKKEIFTQTIYRARRKFLGQGLSMNFYNSQANEKYKGMEFQTGETSDSVDIFTFFECSRCCFPLT